MIIGAEQHQTLYYAAEHEAPTYLKRIFKTYGLRPITTRLIVQTFTFVPNPVTACRHGLPVPDPGRQISAVLPVPLSMATQRTELAKIHTAVPVVS
jgi:hypothetical protein